ncbi:MAG: hypothetical protein E7437_03920 [Ruminococcaceae bacterium]|nr:hypothetical protein [Oscillospiraceae bacterium]
MKPKTRLIALFLCICLIFTMLPHVAPPAEASKLASAVGHFLLSRGIMAAVTGLSAIGKYTDNTETTAMINKWVFGVIDTVTPGLEAIAELSEHMTALHREVMAELDFIEQKMDRNISGIESALGSAAANDAYDNYLSAWNTDVTVPLAANGYHHVVNAYKTYLEFAGSYKTGTTVAYGGVQVTATQDMVADCRASFRSALEALSGAVYDASVHGSDMTAYYDHVLYETNAIDLKARSAINNLIGRLLNASDAPAGSRYLDRAAQVAYAYFPYSEDQAAFVDAAIMKQSNELTMALLAYQEFIGMRTEYCQAKYAALEASGASDEALETLRLQLEAYCAPNSSILDLIYGGPACTHVGGATASMNTWLSDPIYISNANNSYLYLEDYIRATNTDRVILTNTNFSAQSDFDTILAESEEGTVASVIDSMINFAMIERGFVEPHAVSSANTVREQMEFVRRGVVAANRDGKATVKYVYLLADPAEDKSGRLVRDLNVDKTTEDLAFTPLMGFRFGVPHVDYYNLRGVYSDGCNGLTMISSAELQHLVDNNPLSSQGGVLRNYFADVLGTYPEGRGLVVLTSEGTTSGTGDNQYYTEYKGVNMLTAATFVAENVTHDALDNTSYTVMLAAEDTTYGILTAQSDSLQVSLSGEGYDPATGRTAAASAVTLTVTPNDCQKISRITAQYHEDPTDPAKVTYTEVLVEDAMVDTLAYGDNGAAELVYYMPYTNVTLVVEGQSGHPYSPDGFCTVCGAYEPAVRTEKGHLIANAGQLYWFSAAIRGDMTHISGDDLPTLDAGQTMSALYGTITAPIDLSVAEDPWVPIGTADVPYRGNFDGGNQPITNLSGMLFGYADSVELRNIAIESGSFGSQNQEDTYIGSIVGYLNGSSGMIHCYSKSVCTSPASVATGGLAGTVNNGTLQDCYYAGSLSSVSQGVAGGLVGSCGMLEVENCSVAAAVPKSKSGGLVGRASVSPTITNSYYDTDWVASSSACYSHSSVAPEAAKSYEVYHSGEVAYLLNAGREATVWYQTIGQQEYPQFTGLPVYYVEDENRYSNDPEGICTHPEEKLTQTVTPGSGTHTIQTSCSCDKFTTSVTEACFDNDADGACDLCGYLFPIPGRVAAVYEAGQQVSAHESLGQAIAACAQGQYVVLMADVTENVTVSSNLYLDLNGFVLTGSVTGEGTLHGFDNSGDAYTLPTGRIEGTVSCRLANNFKADVTGTVKRYLTISDAAGYSFHRIYLGITHMNLKPSVTGVGYKALFGADEAVQALFAETETYGYRLWVGNGTKHTYTLDASDFVTGKALTLRLRDFDVAGYGETPVYGQVFMKLSDGTVIESAVYSYTLRSMVEYVAANMTKYNHNQLTALQAMLNENADAVKDWDIDPIRNYQAE